MPWRHLGPGVLSLRGLALETWFREPAERFYRTHLDAPVRDRTERSVTLDVGGGHVLQLREPGARPRGGLHVHYALAVPAARYEDWWDRLAGLEPHEHEFGSARSLYVYDPDDHCLELAGVAEDAAAPLDGVFEVVLEVLDLERAVAFWTELGFEVLDRGGARERVRLRGPVDLELWEPQRGLADARGGVHVALAAEARDPAAAVAPVADLATARERLPDEAGGGVRVTDPDGHVLTVRPPAGDPGQDEGPAPD